MRQVVLLRGVNLGSRNRVAMPALREMFKRAGFGDVRTYLQSGNVVLASDSSPGVLAAQCERLVAEAFSLDLSVLVRTGEELREVVRLNPLRDVAVDPKRYQVTFLDTELPDEVLERLTALAAPTERLVALGREIYAWHPEGVARSRLWARLGSHALGVPATSRNWTTVTTLLEMASE
jgi:uncharacterized protein (DUF1697 family)